MRFLETSIGGAWVVSPELLPDERGFFARAWCRKEFADHGLSPNLSQCSISFNRQKGTLRGMHYQIAPHREAKLVRCTRGAIYDVILDLRPESPTYTRWHAIELSAENHEMLYIPEGVAHGFQTLADDSEVFYQITAAFEPSAARGVRWDDPAFSIDWPDAERIISVRDRGYADFAL